MKKPYQYSIGIDEAGRQRRASPRSVYTHLIGIDEAGRGPFAGPVVVAGVRMHSKFKIKSLKFWKGIKDSKKLSSQQREQWFSILTNHPHIEYTVARVWPTVIDRINIAQAANVGAQRVYKKLSKEKSCYALLDGSLYLKRYEPHETIIKGDEKIPLISAASIIAKVTRDRIMLRLHKKFPQYRFDLHKGYGTALHLKLLRKYGYSEAHRKTFQVRLAKKP